MLIDPSTLLRLPSSLCQASSLTAFILRPPPARVLVSTFLSGLSTVALLAATVNISYADDFSCTIDAEQLTAENRETTLSANNTIEQGTTGDSGNIEASANEIIATEKETLFKGEVIITNNELTLTADEARYNSETQQIELNGNIQIDSKNATLGGNSALYNLADQSKNISDASYAIKSPPTRGKAESITTDANDTTTITKGSYTRCDPDNLIWAVKAKEIVLEPSTGQGKARHATLSLYNTPVFYFPYAQFPIGDQRQSGFLFPRLANTNSGFDVSLPYYLNIAPNIDATLSPRYKEGHGYINEGQARWLNHFDEWSLSGSYIDSDRSATEQSASDPSRWAVQIKEDGRIGENFRTRVRYNNVSDADFQRDLDTASFALSRATYLTQSASARFHSLNWDAGIEIQAFRELDQDNTADSDNYEQLPSLWVSYQSSPKVFRPSIYTELRHSELRNETLVDGSRSYGELSLGLPMQIGVVDITPNLIYEHRHYALDAATTLDTTTTPTNTQSGQKLDIGAAIAQLNMATTLHKSHGEINKTLTPRLIYQQQRITQGKHYIPAIPHFDTAIVTNSISQLEQRSRFGGYDAVDELEQLTFILNRKRYNRSNGSLLDISVGQQWYLDSTDENDNALLVFQPENRQSALIGELSYHRNHVTSDAQLQWDADNNELQQAYSGLSWRNDPRQTRHLLNLGYSYRQGINQRIEQAEVSFVSYLNTRWGLFGKYQFDFENDRHSESLAGIEYNSCCVRLRLVYRDGVVFDPLNSNTDEYDRNIFLQIELKGLMSLGRAVENTLEEAIYNFNP